DDNCHCADSHRVCHPVAEQAEQHPAAEPRTIFARDSVQSGPDPDLGRGNICNDEKLTWPKHLEYIAGFQAVAPRWPITCGCIRARITFCRCCPPVSMKPTSVFISGTFRP